MAEGKRPDPGEAIDDLVDRFAVALRAKLRAAEAKRGWEGAWAIPDWEEGCQADLLHHVGKGDPVDVAAYAAFCWHHGWPTSAPAVQAPPAPRGEPDGGSRAPGPLTTSIRPGSVAVIPLRPLPQEDAARIRAVMDREDAGETADLVIRCGGVRPVT